ncbi:MAG TPA: hypothetical protein VD973_13120 [Symbiobacteriaceae bacterium]|nr:hypothetical protein [Symbiobacteriaceae bacterium]
MPSDSEMLPAHRVDAAIRAAYEAGKSAERFFDRRGLGRAVPGKPLKDEGDLDRTDSREWHH